VFGGFPPSQCASGSGAVRNLVSPRCVSSGLFARRAGQRTRPGRPGLLRLDLRTCPRNCPPTVLVSIHIHPVVRFGTDGGTTSAHQVSAGGWGQLRFDGSLPERPFRTRPGEVRFLAVDGSRRVNAELGHAPTIRLPWLIVRPAHLVRHLPARSQPADSPDPVGRPAHCGVWGGSAGFSLSYKPT